MFLKNILVLLTMFGILFIFSTAKATVQILELSPEKKSANIPYLS